MIHADVDTIENLMENEVPLVTRLSYTSITNDDQVEGHFGSAVVLYN